MKRIAPAASDPRKLAGSIHRPDGVIQVTGPGAVACIQGLFTNDIESGNLPLLRWGAFLTPKGMIVSDLWIARDENGCLLIVPAAGVAAVGNLLNRSFPPRLAKVVDRSDELSVRWLTGPESTAREPGSLTPDGPAPFRALLLEDRQSSTDRPDALPVEVADQVMLLDGWPVLGREIDDRTLVQEVRFDDLAGVRYDKGCYVGQETVARLHFRGHANRTLRAVTGTGTPPDDPSITSAEGRIAGTGSTCGVFGERWIVSARIRREVADGSEVSAGGVAGTVIPFPVEPLD